ncbi:MAG TPA: DNA recombination protein RmuC, partial [Anaerolineae bacterium]|nr:DNA recombination protein RmuC [Anaerolineae bacterium]
MDPLMLVLIVLVVLLLGAVLLLLAMQYLQLRSSQRDVERAVITEKLSQLEPVSQVVTSIRQDLAELQAYTKAYNRAREDLERRTADSVRRLEMVIAGTQTKGAAGENILEAVFANLPPEWQVRNFRVGDKAVEFGLRLPNNLILPIDSKWPATHLLEQFT